MGRLSTWWRCRIGNQHAMVAEVYAKSMWSYGRRLLNCPGQEVTRGLGRERTDQCVG